MFRFFSAYVLVIFSIQRLFLVYSPFSNKFKSTKSGWTTVVVTGLISTLLNSWVPFLFSLQPNGNLNSCDVKRERGREYFLITIVYICLIMLFPILILFTSNFLIIFDLLRTNFKSSNKNSKNSITNLNSAKQTIKSTPKKLVRLKDNSAQERHLKPYYYNMNQIINRVNQKVSYREKNLKRIHFLIFFLIS